MGGKRPVLLFAAAGLLLVVVAARGASPVPSTINLGIDHGPPPLPIASGGEATGPRGTVGDPVVIGNIVIGLLIVLCVLAVVLSAISAYRLRHRQGIGRVAEAVEGTVDTVPRLRLKEAVQEARDILAREGGVPRDAVIEAWVTLENATEHRREPHETATEFTVALLEKENADEVALRELRTLYQRARFGAATVDDDAADKARDALDRILVTIR